MGNRIHRIDSFDPDAGTVTCRNCGVVPMTVKDGYPKCSKARKASRKKYASKVLVTNGYVRLLQPDGTYKREHRIVMEKILGRELLPGENVHHVNGVRSDNRPENLELWVTYQPAGQRPEDLVVWAREIEARYGHLV